MAIPRGEAHGLGYVMEVEPGTTPGSPTMLTFRHNTCGLIPARENFVSEESRGHRQVQDLRLGVKSGTGEVTSELVYGDHDNMIQLGLLGEFPVAFTQIAAATISVTESTGTIADSGSGLGDIEVGDWIITAGFATGGNNGVFRVLTASAAAITVNDPDDVLVDEALGASVTIDQQVRCSVGNTLQTATIERRFPDMTVPTYGIFRGSQFNTFRIEAGPGQITMMTMDMLARSVEYATTSLGVPTAPSSLSPMDGLSGTFAVDGVTLAGVQTISVEVANNLSPHPSYGATSLYDIIERRAIITGQMTRFFEDETDIDDLDNETEVEYSFQSVDPAGNIYTTVVPRLKVTGVDNPKTDDDGIMETVSFQALYDSVDALTSMYIYKTDA